jgi:hypothetical protein
MKVVASRTSRSLPKEASCLEQFVRDVNETDIGKPLNAFLVDTIEAGDVRGDIDNRLGRHSRNRSATNMFDFRNSGSYTRLITAFSRTYCSGQLLS